MRILTVLLIAVGLVVCGYLVSRHVQLAVDATRAGPDVCSVVFGKSCDATLTSPFAKLFGLPLAGWGIVYFGALASLLLTGWIIGNAFQAAATLTALGLALAGGCVSLLLFSTMATGVVPFCPLCLVVQFSSVALVPALKSLSRRSWSKAFRGFASGLWFVVSGRSSDPSGARQIALGLSASGLVGIVLFQWMFIQIELRARGQDTALDSHELLAKYESSPAMEIPIGADDPRLGPGDAPDTLVVFSDFRCPGCRRFAREMPRLLEHPGHPIQIVFKHFPLDAVCNDTIGKSIHPGACEAAWAAEAARRQGAFWDFHDALVSADLTGDSEDIVAIAERLGLDPDQFKADLNLQAVKDRIKADVALGKQLEVIATPTLFLNGRRVPDTRLAALMSLIDHATRAR